MTNNKSSAHTVNHDGGISRRLPLGLLSLFRKTPPLLRLGLLGLAIAALWLFLAAPFAEPAAAQLGDRLTLTLRGVSDSPVVCYQASGSWTAPGGAWMSPRSAHRDVAVPHYSSSEEEWAWVTLKQAHLGGLVKGSDISGRELSNAINYSHKGTILTRTAGEFAQYNTIDFTGTSVGLSGPPRGYPAVSPGETVSWSGRGTIRLKENFGDTFPESAIGRSFEPPGIPFRLVIEGGPNQKPIADPGMEQWAFEGHKLSLDGTGSADPDGCPLTYEWSIPTDFGLINGDTPVPTLEIPYVTETTHYSIALTVSDPQGLSSESHQSIWVMDDLALDPSLEVESVMGGSNGRVNIKIKLRDGEGNDYSDEWYFRQPRGNRGCTPVSTPIATVKNLKPFQKYIIKAYSQEGCRHLLASLTFPVLVPGPMPVPTPLPPPIPTPPFGPRIPWTLPDLNGGD